MENNNPPINPYKFENDKNFSEKAKFTCKNPHCGYKADLTYDKLNEKVWKLVHETTRCTKCCGGKRWDVRNSDGHILYSY